MADTPALFVLTVTEYMPSDVGTDTTTVLGVYTFSTSGKRAGEDHAVKHGYTPDDEDPIDWDRDDTGTITGWIDRGRYGGHPRNIEYKITGHQLNADEGPFYCPNEYCLGDHVTRDQSPCNQYPRDEVEAPSRPLDGDDTQYDDEV